MDFSEFDDDFEEIRRLYMDPDTVHLAISREIALRDHLQRLEDAYNRGYEKGLALVKNKTRVDMIIKMIELSFSLPFIAEVTDLSVEEVQTIINGYRKDS